MAYLAPIHRPSSVRHAITLSFLAPDSPDLIVARSNRLEIWTPAPTSPPTHVLQHSKTVYGRITLLHKIRPATSETDHLFVGTDRYHYFTLSWDPATSSLKTEKSYVDIAEKAARDSQTGDRVAIDPSSRFMALECYEGVINILPIAYPGKGKRRAAESEIGELGDPIPVRIPELFVRSTCFVHKRSPGSKLASPEIALLHEDSTNRVRLKVRMLDYSPSMRPQEEPHTAELEDAKGRGNDKEMDPGSSHLIPLPAPMYGLLVVGETSISYADEWEYNITHTQALKDATVFVAWCAVDAQRYVLADDYGTLYLLFVHQKADGEYSGHQIDVLGETSRASTLVYLDAGMIFVGSHQGDSQIIQIREGSGIEVLQTFANIAPILDFTVMDMGNRSAEAVVNEFSSGQARIVTGSGAFRDGSLRSVRSGVGLEDNGSIGDMGGPVSAVFSLAREPSRSVDVVDTLVVSLVATTRIFCFDGAREVEELEVFGAFSFDEPTIYAGHLAHQEGALLVQVTPSAVLVSQSGLESTKAVQTFAPGKPITAVSADGSTLLLSLGGEALTLISISASAIQTLAQASFEGSQQQVACIALSSAVPDLAVVGFWNGGVSCLSRTTLQETASVHVDVDGEASGAVPRSLLVARILGQTPTLFVGLADGNVVTYTMASAAEPFTARKSIVLGTQQANFTLLPRNSGDGLENVFATCEHPSLIYGSEGRMVYSAVTAEGASVVCAFNAEGFSNAIAIATAEGELKIGSVDEERTTHVQTLPVHETVRRIAYSAELKAFGLGTIKRTLRAGVEEVQSSFKLVDEVAFQELHSYALMTDELVESCIRCQLDDGNGELAERFLVGTAFLDDSVEGTRGRLLVLEITEERRLKVVTELKLKGACRCLAMVEGRIVAALVKTVVVFAFEYETPSNPFLVKKAAYRTATAPIDVAVCGNTIAVTDLMKSVSLLTFTHGRAGRPDTLTEIARHFETLWGTAVANVGPETWLASDAEGNLVVLQHDVDGLVDEQKRLRVTSEILLGEMVNRIRSIAVTPTPAALVIPKAFLATVEGSIYLFGFIAEGKQDLLIRMQSAMMDMVVSPGNVDFKKFRGFRSQVRDMGEVGPSRFVDGELIEQFLDLGEAAQQKVCEKLKTGLEETKGMVEGLRRIH